jgi:hypothetical protein
VQYFQGAMSLKKWSSLSLFFKKSYSLEFISGFYLLVRCFPSISHLKYASLSHFPAKKLEHLLSLALCVRWKGKDCGAILNQVAPFSIPEWDCSCYPCHIFCASEFNIALRQHEHKGHGLVAGVAISILWLGVPGYLEWRAVFIY